MFVTNWISTTKIQKISEITNFFRHYFLSRTEVVFDSTFERFSRNLIPLIFLGIAMSNKKIFSKNYIFGNKLKGVLFVGYILVMCWMDIINGYMDTIVMPLFNNNLFNI